MIAAAAVALVVSAMSAAAPAPSPAEGLARAAARAADDDDRFEVVSELEVQDAVALEAQRQSCGGDGASCAAQLAGAFDARYVLFLRLYSIDGARHLAFTLTDVKDGHVIARDDEAGDDGALVDAVARVVPRELSLIEDKAQTRLFVSRVVDESGVVEPAANVGLIVAGAAVGVVGVVAGGVGGYFAVNAAGVLQDKDTAGSAKDAAQTEAALGTGAIVVGVVAVAAAVVLIVVGVE